VTTQQFKWIDRDTAARDMLQLVYHASPQIAMQALKLLKAIRSPVLIPDLKAIFLDEDYDKYQREKVYEVICATSATVAPIVPSLRNLRRDNAC